MENATLITRQMLPSLICIVAFAKISTAHIDTKHPANLFNENAPLYVNGPQVNFEELEQLTMPHSEQTNVEAPDLVAKITLLIDTQLHIP
ncbi:hypothetical protein BBBOND_0209940 [Babesia bigemina]|uniref:Uncharacterized protein n=1 Tax=Babesia bigemina TaxID=5866 RepID=A0A061D586_BABBI|nr:hypothetical protein BBBOND_0209940 [Babesia bigemina]CDR95841.1 hypothetical protein BBBOND_0209940 [Babesia bigemina]|eukprot:XP_012768027.1 hypothetical protein BBBOND_0209940 [Babesia bigemina]